MKKGNIIDLLHYRQLPGSSHENTPNLFMSEELKYAIENLIEQLRYFGPIQKKH